MKRILSIAFCVLLLCSMLLMANVATTLATEPGYSVIMENYMGTSITVDGKWTSTSEWADAWTEKQFPPSANARFMYKMDSSQGAGPYRMLWLVEFADSTNDAGDIWRICIDGSQDGGTSPKADDNKIEITGHTTMKVYVGNGTGWTNMTTYTTGIQWSNSLSTASPNMTANHWVLEVSADKGTAFPVWGANPPPSGLYVGMYDASNPTQGWVHWPATSADIPDRWGSIGSFGTEIPEGLSFGLIVALSSVAVVIGSVYLWKRPKTIIPVRL